MKKLGEPGRRKKKKGLRVASISATGISTKVEKSTVEGGEKGKGICINFSNGDVT